MTSLCPTSETRVYTRRIGDDMDVARSRRDGSPMPPCPPLSRTAQLQGHLLLHGQGLRLATGYSARYDQTLRVGDAVMTRKA